MPATITLAHTAINQASGTLSSLTIPASTIGNLGLVSFCYTSSDTITAVTGGGTWARVGARQLDSTNGQVTETWATLFTSSVTSITFTNAAAITIAYDEFNSSTGWSSATPHASDATKAFGTTTTGTGAETSNAITASAGDLVVSTFADTQGNLTSIAAGAGWTIAANEIGAAGTGASSSEWKQSAGASETGAFTVSTAGHKYTCQIFAFSPNSSGVTANGNFLQFM